MPPLRVNCRLILVNCRLILVNCCLDFGELSFDFGELLSDFGELSFALFVAFSNILSIPKLSSPSDLNGPELNESNWSLQTLYSLLKEWVQISYQMLL